MTNYDVLIGIHYFLPQLKSLEHVDKYLRKAKESGLKVGLIVVDDTSLDLSQIFQLLQRQYVDIDIYYLNGDAQKPLFEECPDDLSRYFKKPFYANGRNKILLVATLLQGAVVELFDLDTAPQDDDNIIQELKKPFDEYGVVAVSGDYAENDPRPLTAAFLEKEAHESFYAAITACNSGLGPNGQRLVGGCHALHSKFWMKCAPPPIPMCVWSDDSFMDEVARQCGFNVKDSSYTVRHHHDEIRLQPDWIVTYLAERVARGVILLPIALPMLDAFKDIILNGSTKHPLKELAKKGWSEASDKLNMYIKTLRNFKPSTIVDLQPAVQQAIDKLEWEENQRIGEVVDGLIAWADFLKSWQSAMDGIQSLSSDTRQQILNAIKV